MVSHIAFRTDGSRDQKRNMQEKINRDHFIGSKDKWDTILSNNHGIHEDNNHPGVSTRWFHNLACAPSSNVTETSIVFNMEHEKVLQKKFLH